MNDDVTSSAVSPGAPSPTPLPAPAAAPVPRRRWRALWAALLVLLTLAALGLALATQQRVKRLEQELVRRQQDSQSQAAEARLLARQAQDAAREAAAKVALLEVRVSDATLQRSQLEELIQSLSRSRDENVVADVEAAVRVAMQHSAITGSAEPLVAALKQAEERLARHNQPRLERVRRAILRDLDKAQAVAVADVSTLAIRLDEAVRQVDELPLLAQAQPPRAGAPARRQTAARPDAQAAPAAPDWRDRVDGWWRTFSAAVWEEVRGLVRVTRIEDPEAVLASPEQAFFVRENLKLRLLNARLAVLSRQFDTAQADLRDAQAVLERYFDRGSKRVQLTAELVRQVAQQARLVSLPRPDETLAALATAAAGR